MRGMVLRGLLGIAVVGAALSAAGAARAEGTPHVISAFALTRQGDPPARLVQYYDAARRLVPQPPVDAVVKRRPARS